VTSYRYWCSCRCCCSSNWKIYECEQNGCGCFLLSTVRHDRFTARGRREQRDRQTKRTRERQRARDIETERFRDTNKAEVAWTRVVDGRRILDGRLWSVGRPVRTTVSWTDAAREMIGCRTCITRRRRRRRRLRPPGESPWTTNAATDWPRPPRSRRETGRLVTDSSDG